MVLGVAMIVSAASVFDITFPIPELGNCADRQECKAYCDELVNASVCSTFAQAHGLGQATKKPTLSSTGPGGCTTGTECKTYCDDTSHYDECLTFGESHGLLSKKEIQEARGPIKGPGGCSSLDECKAYCSDGDNELECAGFGNKQGQISSEEYKKIKEVKEQGGPGGCKSEKECRLYCEDASHLDECLSFGESHGFVSRDEAAAIRKAGIAGPGPGGCQGNEACREYCGVPAHQDECLDYAQEKGLMTKDEADTARKFVGRTGPGGCKGAQECRAYCEDPAHGEECLAEAKEHKLLSQDEITKAQKILEATEQGGPGGCKGPKECQAYCKVEDHREECFAFAKRQGLISKEDESEFDAGRRIQQTVEQSGGPGGCKNDGECKAYCSDASHAEECVAFASAHGGISDTQARGMLEQFIKGKTGERRTLSDEFQQTEEDSFRKFDEYKQLERQFRKQGDQSSDVIQRRGQRGGDAGGDNEDASRPSFVGPGGCTNANACISYCAEHKDECFKHLTGSGQEDRGGDKNNENFAPKPQLRSDIIKKIDEKDLPEGFEQRTSEEKHQFFQEKFQEFRGEQGAFPGKPSQGFPGKENTEQETGDNRHDNEGDSLFKGAAPQKGAPGIFAPTQRDQRDNGQMPTGENMPKPFEGSGRQQGDQQRPMDEQRRPGGMPDQQGMPPGIFHPQEKGFPPQQDGQLQHPSGEDMRGDFQPPSAPDGNVEQHAPPPPDGGMEGGGGMMPPPPSSLAPFNGLFAGLIQAFFPR